MSTRGVVRSVRNVAWMTVVCGLLACGGDGSTTTPPPPSPPGAPTIGGVTEGDGTLTLTFSPPASIGSSAITGYTASCVAASGTRTGAGAASPIAVTGLTNNTAYSCTVTAANAVGSGPASAAVSGTPRAPASPPGAPTIGSVTEGDGRLTIAFSPPASVGSSAITSYTASCVAAGTTTTGTGTASPIAVTGLTNGTAYSCSVTATNAVGTGPASAAVSGTPKAASTTLALTSVGGVSTGELSVAYTCDGTAVSPPLVWAGAPSGTVGYAVIMSTVPVSGPSKYNWLLYSIPAGTTSLAADAKTTGTFGNADDGGGLAYAPPCSPGAGAKEYTFTVYALSGSPNLSGLTAEQVTGTVLTAALAPVTIASVSLTLTVTRTQTTINCTQIRTSFAAYATSNSLSLTCDATYGFFNTFGIQSAHAMMNGITATNQQVPLAQNFTGANAWRIPLLPTVAATNVSANDGPIGIAVNGVPLFNPCKQGGCNAAAGGGDTKVLGELDLCNGHAGRADDYHYHAAPVCMMANQAEHYWDTHPLGWALDGFGIFGYFGPDGATATRDNICGGNTTAHPNAPSGYAYHVTEVSPYILSCFFGDPSPDFADQAQKFSPLRPPGTPVTASNMTLNATATSLAIGGTTTMQWTSGGSTFEILYRRTSNLCWNFIFRTNGAQTSTSDYCRSF
jgi:phosphatidylethanolamine-binding protein (PEBP) family uncharacterized protein